MLPGHDCDDEFSVVHDGEGHSVLAYTADDRWLVFGNETRSDALVLAVMFCFGWNEVMGDA